MENLGVNISFASLQELKKILHTVSETGYDTVYFGAGISRHSLNEVKECAKMLQDFSLMPFSAHNIECFPELNREPESIVPVQEAVFEKAALLEVKYLTCHFGQCRGLQQGDNCAFEKCLQKEGISSGDYRSENIEILKILCQRARKYNLTLTVENLPEGYFVDFSKTIPDLLRIIKEVDEPNLGICFDSGHANISGIDLYESILEAGTDLYETHFHDNFGNVKENPSANDIHQPVGFGTINWIAVIAGLKKIAFSYPVVFEISTNVNILSMNEKNWYHFNTLYKNIFPDWPEGQK